MSRGRIWREKMSAWDNATPSDEDVMCCFCQGEIAQDEHVFTEPMTGLPVCSNCSDDRGLTPKDHEYFALNKED